MAERRPDRTLGPGHDQFWEFCSQGELRLQRCASCGKLAWPVVASCEYCESAELNWALMSGRGQVIGWCTFERDYYAGAVPIPWDTVLVELEEGPLFISNPKDFSWRDIDPDTPVKLAFIECEDRMGSFKLPVFERF